MLDYAAPLECPSAEVFAERAAREDTAEAGSFFVRIEKTSSGYLGKIGRDASGPAREVVGSSCTDVVEALAVIARTSLRPEETSPGVGAATADTPSVTPRPATTHRDDHSSAADWHLYFGGHAAAGTAAVAGAEAIVGGEVDVERPWASGARMSLRLVTQHALFRTIEHVGAYRHVFSAGTCPWQPRFGLVQLGPCAHLGAGWLVVSGQGVKRTEEHTLFWLEWAASGRVVFDLEAARLAFEVGMFQPLLQHAVAFGPPQAPQGTLDLSKIGLRAGLALSVRIL